MMSTFTNCSVNLNDIDELVQKFLSILHTQLGIPETDLQLSWKETQSSVLQDKHSQSKSTKTSEKKDETSQSSAEKILTCQMMMKRKNQICGKKVSKNSKTGRYCGTHCKSENSNVVENSPDLSNYHVFKKNSFDRYVYGDTGLILKSKDEQKIVGHQGSNGVVRDLTAEEISLCQRRRLEYIANYHANLNENCEISKVNTVAHTSKLNFL